MNLALSRQKRGAQIGPGTVTTSETERETETDRQTHTQRERQRQRQREEGTVGDRSSLGLPRWSGHLHGEVLLLDFIQVRDHRDVCNTGAG